jgi:hypothetical protein
MSAKKDWKMVGSFVATLVQLFSIISEVFKKAEIGLEIIEWLIGSGKLFFTEKLAEIIEEYKQLNLPVLKDVIDLDAIPSLPFEGARIEKHIGGGKVTIEKRVDGLYIDGKKIVLYRSQLQLSSSWVIGHDLREELTGKLVLNAVVADFLYAHPRFIPDDWKGLVVHFWGTIYRNTGDNLFVPYICWSGGKWNYDYDCLIFGFRVRDLAAVSAS